MNEIDTIGAVSGETDIDDVEGHGMKEVMVGLSAAAVLTGGVAAVVSSGGDGGASRGRATISADTLDEAASEADASGVDRASARSGSIGGHAVRAGSSANGGDVASVLGTRISASSASLDDEDDVTAATFLGSRFDRLDGMVDRTVDWTRDVRRDAVATTRQAVSDVRTTVKNAPATADRLVQATVNPPSVSDTVAQARSTVREASAEARRQVDGTIVVAGDLVRGVEGTAMTTIARIQPGVGASFDVATATGWVTVSVGGEEIARAQLKDGQATLTYQAPSADLPLTVALSGSDLLTAPPVTL